MIRSLLIRARLLALATLIALFGIVSLLPSQASAEWTGYWTWNWLTRSWTWIWVWVSPGGTWIAG